MESARADNIPTIAAIGLLAYASADVAHHALGHGVACLASGGRIISLSSIYLDCTRSDMAIDVSGPAANLLIGLAALLACHIVRSAPLTTRLFLVLAAAFNLLWFAMQLVFSVITTTDDWAAAIHEFHLTGATRAGMIVVGALVYLATVRWAAAKLTYIAQPAARVITITLTAWLTAGIIACATAAFDHHPIAAVLRHAAPQSLGNAVGLLFVPRLTAKLAAPGNMDAPLAMSIPWVLAAGIVAAASIILLGPGHR
jgi:hypothetical protein